MYQRESMKVQISNVSTETEILRKNQKEMSAIKSTATEMKNTFDGFISRFDIAEENLLRFRMFK